MRCGVHLLVTNVHQKAVDSLKSHFFLFVALYFTTYIDFSAFFFLFIIVIIGKAKKIGINHLRISLKKKNTSRFL